MDDIDEIHLYIDEWMFLYAIFDCNIDYFKYKICNFLKEFANFWFLTLSFLDLTILFITLTCLFLVKILAMNAQI